MIGEANYDWLMKDGPRYVGWATAITSGQLQCSWVEALLPTMRSAVPALVTLAACERGAKGDVAYSLVDQAVNS